MEAKYIGITHAVKEATWVCHLLSELYSPLILNTWQKGVKQIRVKGNDKQIGDEVRECVKWRNLDDKMGSLRGIISWTNGNDGEGARILGTI